MNEEAFLRLCEQLAGHPWLLGALVAVGTCFLEDPGRVAVTLLVAAGQISWKLALVSMTIGAVMGDVGLYLIGRYALDFIMARRWISAARLAWMEDYFSRHAFQTILLARFLAGTRTVAYCAAGVARYPLPRYLLILTAAGALQAVIFLLVGDLLGDYLLPYLKERRILTLVILLTIVLGSWLYWRIARRRKNRITAAE